MIKRSTVVAVVLAAVAAFLPAARANAEVVRGTDVATDGIAGRDGCERTTSTVRLATDATPYRIAGWLCTPPRPRRGEVQFLIHGFTYNHLYWMGLGVDRLDYVRAATRQGRTTFVIDQLGAGASDHPEHPTQVTSGDLAYLAHQLVGQLRTGQIGRAHTRFQRVIGVGHSMGASVWILEAGTYHDVNAVILADELHATNAEFLAVLGAHIVPANTLRRFAGLPDGYLAVEPRSLFYDVGLASPSVIELDENIGIDTTGQFALVPDPGDPRFSTAITVPVLIVVGRRDAVNCNEAAGLSCATAAAVLDREASFFPAASCLDAFVFDSGHGTNLHRASPQWFAYAGNWVDAATHGHPSTRNGSCLPH